MSQNTCRKAKVIRPEEGGSDPADRTRGSKAKSPPLSPFGRDRAKNALRCGSIGGNGNGTPGDSDI